MLFVVIFLSRFNLFSLWENVQCRLSPFFGAGPLGSKRCVRFRGGGSLQAWETGKRRLTQTPTEGETTRRGLRGGPQDTGLFPQAEKLSPSRKVGQRKDAYYDAKELFITLSAIKSAVTLWLAYGISKVWDASQRV